MASWECEACDDADPILCDGCGCCQQCCSCTETDCDCDACSERRSLDEPSVPWSAEPEYVPGPSILTAAPGSGLVVGDLITISGRLARWKRILIWLRLMKRPKPRQMKIIAMTGTSMYVDERDG